MGFGLLHLLNNHALGGLVFGWMGDPPKPGVPPHCQPSTDWPARVIEFIIVCSCSCCTSGHFFCEISSKIDTWRDSDLNYPPYFRVAPVTKKFVRSRFETIYHGLHGDPPTLTNIIIGTRGGPLFGCAKWRIPIIIFVLSNASKWNQKWVKPVELGRNKGYRWFGKHFGIILKHKKNFEKFSIFDPQNFSKSGAIQIL